MSSDGTNSYQWDAENRLIRINYPGTGNYSQFSYDGFGRNVLIQEYVSSSLNSTKQLVWNGNRRREARNAAGTIRAQYFDLGETISGTSYFYTSDHLGSTREMTNTSAVIQAQYAFNPYGDVTKISETIPSDSGFAGIYTHSRSGFNLTWFRQYDASLGRWITRDPLGQEEGRNLYTYAGNNPARNIDPLGLQNWGAWGPESWRNDALEHCIASCQLARIFGKDTAKAIGDAWEDKPPVGPISSGSQMDLNNNAVGREGGSTCQNCGDYCRGKLESGQLYGPLGGGNSRLAPPPVGENTTVHVL